MKRGTRAEGGEGVGAEEGATRGLGKDTALQGIQFAKVSGVAEEIGEFPAASVPVLQAADDPAAQAAGERAPEGTPAVEPRKVAERRVTAKEFVAPEAGERDGHAAGARGLAGVIGVNAVTGRLVQGREDSVEVAGDLRARENVGSVVGAEMAGRGLGVGAFGKISFVEDDRKCPKSRAAGAGHQADDDRRVESAREERSDGHIGDDVGADGVVEAGAKLGGKFFARGARFRGRGNRVKAPRGTEIEATRAKGRTFAGAQTEDLTVDRARRGHGEPREVVGDRERIDLGGERAGREQRVEFGREDQSRAIVPVVEGLDAEGIAGEEERAFAIIPDGEGEHPAQTREAALAPGGESGEEDFGVAVRAKRPARGGEFVAQGAEVVDRAVENEREPPVGRPHRLMAVRRVENRETAHPEGRVPWRFESGVIGAAMDHRGAHARHRIGAELARALRIDDSGYAAHQRMELTWVFRKASLRHVLAEATGSGRGKESHSDETMGCNPHDLRAKGCS